MSTTMSTKKKVAKKVSKSNRTLLVCVGVGGVFYHGIPRLAVWCQRRGEVDVLLIDHDKIEEKNRLRQWGNVGQYKVQVAEQVLKTLGISSRWVLNKYTDMLPLIICKNQYTDCTKVYTRVVVIAAPDNHMCRMEVHEGCKALALETGLEVHEITAGNDMEGGYAYGCVWKGVPPGPGGIVKDMCEGDWTARHYDIVRGAIAEQKQLEHPEACGSMQENRVGQTMLTNQLTALCIWDLAEMMAAEDKVGEVCWRNVVEENGTTRYTKVWATLTDRTWSKEGR